MVFCMKLGRYTGAIFGNTEMLGSIFGLFRALCTLPRPDVGHIRRPRQFWKNRAGGGRRAWERQDFHSYPGSCKISGRRHPGINGLSGETALFNLAVSSYSRTGSRLDGWAGVWVFGPRLVSLRAR